MVVWLIGMSGAGKTELGSAVVSRVRSTGRDVVLVDGDVVRAMFGSDLGHSIEDRRRNAHRISRLCHFLDDQGVDVVCCILSIFHETQEWMRSSVTDYFEVFIDVPFATLVARDSKGLYQRALRGQLKDVVGVDIEFVPPKAPDLVIRNDGDIDDLLAHATPIAARLTEDR